ncbi:HAMP domain-containing protein [Desulfolutivibrio sulfoxidireducens]|nr:HAMP domain-containing protein [Desulfolutivibrio sulfoxidireducens]
MESPVPDKAADPRRGAAKGVKPRDGRKILAFFRGWPIYRQCPGTAPWPETSRPYAHIRKERRMAISLKKKILSLVSLAALLPVLVAVSITLVMEAVVADKMTSGLEAITRGSVTQIARDAYGICAITNDLIVEELTESATVALRTMKGLGGIRLGEKSVRWEAENEQTRERMPVTLPEMLCGGTWLGQNTQKSVPTPVVDEVKALTGEEITIFQKMRERGDMIRVATSISSADGIRNGLGSIMPAVHPDGVKNEIIATVLSGKSYRGFTSAMGGHYAVEYAPLINAAGEIIGMFGVGHEVHSMSTLREALLRARVGQTGYVWVVGSRGPDKGRYVLSHNAERDGQSLWDEKDASGTFIVREIIEKALAAPPGEISVIRYPWQNPGEIEPRMKIAAFTVFPPWNWVIGVGVYEDDFDAITDDMHDSLATMRLAVVGSGAAILAVVLCSAALLAARLVRPIERITGVAQRIAGGDILAGREGLADMDAASSGLRGSLASSAETGRLVDAFRTMTASLAGLIGQVRQSGIQVTASATQIAASAREIESAVTEQAASTSQVSATSAQISATSGELVGTMEQVGRAVAETGVMAGESRQDLEAMESAMRRLAGSTEHVSAKLAVISERANTIGSVVVTINKISDQTNLLSLNAAIEAEKAGEYGRGFSVVAREIRRLADQTASATLDIERMIGEMRSAVTAEVMEMDKFADEVRRGVEQVAGLSERLGGIILRVQDIGPRFETVDQGMRAQSLGARQISEAMVQLTEAADQTRQAIMEFNQAARTLNEAVQGLSGEVARFKLDA